MTQRNQNAFIGSPFACLLFWLLHSYGCVLFKRRRKGGRKREEKDIERKKPSLVPSSEVSVDDRIMISS